MKYQFINSLLTGIFLFPTVLVAGGDDPKATPHKYWVCAISSYYSLVDGKREEGKCRANTEYSEPQCREFYVDEGEGGVHLGQAYKKTSTDNNQMNSSNSINQNSPATITITIDKQDDHYLYKHLIERTSNNAADQWVYNGKCTYYEAPMKEKIYLHKGLDTSSTAVRK